ncbi:hypothetical protein AB4571_15330 [Vibrio breoganii]|nr:hypothetical protein [Vibrio breoganii]PML13831.1 hypothetical protein BCT84_12635 [Vibrio breoganii]
MKNSTYGRVGCKPLPETFDVDFINYINNVYLDPAIWDRDKQDWPAIEKEVHADFDESMGSVRVSRHLEAARG